MEWKTGDIAICINTGYVGHKRGTTNDKYPPLKLYAEYNVLDISKCIKCNRISLDVGFSNKRATLCICGHPGINNGVFWCASERFIKKGINQQQEENKEEEIIVQINT